MQQHRYASITFKIISVTDRGINVEIRQSKSAAENYFDAKRLVEIAHETWDPFVEGIKVMVGSQPYRRPPVDVVDHLWIHKEMVRTGTRIKDIAEDTGVDYTTLSALSNGDKPLSQGMKAMFYYYFMAKKQKN